MFLVSGGYGDDWLDSTEIFDPSLGSWRAGAALPSSREGLRVTTIDNRVLLFGNDILLTLYSVFFFIDLQKQGCCELVFGLMGNPKASK